MGAHNEAPTYRSVPMMFTRGVPQISGFVRWAGCRHCKRWSGSLFNLPAGMLVQCTCGKVCEVEDLAPYESEETP